MMLVTLGWFGVFCARCRAWKGPDCWGVAVCRKREDPLALTIRLGGRPPVRGVDLNAIFGD